MRKYIQTSKNSSEDKHKMSKTKFYNIWAMMKQRCQSINHPNYKRYGKRGICVCDSWQDFDSFKKDMYPTYKEGLMLERINNDGNYESNNCRWTTRKEQSNNRRNNHFIEYKGIRDTLVNWAEFLKIKYSTLSMRINTYKWTTEKSFFCLRNRGKYYVG